MKNFRFSHLWKNPTPMRISQAGLMSMVLTAISIFSFGQNKVPAKILINGSTDYRGAF
jgi:hypothetical protein